jgi:signal transduction histidine kinase
MNVGARITLATTALVTVTLVVYAFFDLRGKSDQRRAAIEREARNIALTARASVEGQGVGAVLTRTPDLVRELGKSGTGWDIAILTPNAVSMSGARWERLQTIVDAPNYHLITQEGDTLFYVVGIRVPPRLPDPEPRAVAALEVSRSTAHLDDAFRADLTRTSLFIGLIVAVTVLAVAGFTRSLMTRPVAKLLAGMDDVARGDLSHVLLSERDDEVGALATRFNEMTFSLRESRAETRRQNEATLELEQRLGQTEKLATIGQLAAEIAHEVGTPLGVIAGRARTLQRKARDPAAVKKTATIISEQTARITRIIQTLLDFTRRKVGISEMAELSLNELALIAMELLQGKLTSANVRHTLHRADGLPLVKGNSDRLQQVLLNLVLNAIQAMPEGGSLTVETQVVRRRRPGLEAEPEHEYVVIEVTDSGVGIPPEKRDKIFEPFYTSKQDDGGTGLGLAVCHGIVKEHDGWIEIRDADAGGTIFAVYLPVVDA